MMVWLDLCRALLFGNRPAQPATPPAPPAQVPQSWDDKNLTACVWMIASGEGGNDTNAYRRLVYGGLFDSFADHPRVHFDRTTRQRVADWRSAPPNSTTSAAGRHQITETTYDGLQRNHPGRWQGFGPQVQDEMCVELIRERGAYDDVIAGRLQVVVQKLAPEWESLKTTSYQKLETTYLAAGGQLATV